VRRAEYFPAGAEALSDSNKRWQDEMHGQARLDEGQAGAWSLLSKVSAGKDIWLNSYDSKYPNSGIRGARGSCGQRSSGGVPWPPSH
jgi:hypothetical protein